VATQITGVSSMVTRQVLGDLAGVGMTCRFHSPTRDGSSG